MIVLTSNHQTCSMSASGNKSLAETFFLDLYIMDRSGENDIHFQPYGGYNICITDHFLEYFQIVHAQWLGRGKKV